MFDRLVVEKRHGHYGNEERLLIEHAKVLGIEVVPAYEKNMARGFIKLTSTDLVAGSVSFIGHALRSLGRPRQLHSDYPSVLNHLLYRKFYAIRTLGEVKRILDRGQSYFIKPYDRVKLFTGFVAESAGDWRFNGASNQTSVYMADPVTFVSEWRVYVCRGVNIDMQYAGDVKGEDIKPDPEVISDAIAKLAAWYAPNAGYAIDFGVLHTGETALVEVNDGYSIGAYGDITAEKYWNVIAARWSQLISRGY